MTITIQEQKKALQQCHIHFLEEKQFKTNVISILLRIPLTRQNTTKTALLAEVLKNGCKKYPSKRAVSQKMDDMLGSVFDISILKKGQEQILFFYLETVKYEKELLKQGFDFLQNMLFAPLEETKGFPKKIVQREKKILEEKIKSRQDDKKEYSKIRCLEEMCKENAFGIFADGYIEDIKEIDEMVLLMHYKNIIKHSKVEIFMTGEKQQKNDMMELANKMRFKSDFLWQTEPMILKQNKQIKQIKQTLHTAQSRIVMGFDTNVMPEQKEFASLLICNELFGGSPTSLLFQNVREKEGACYDINSFLFRLCPILMVKSGIEKQYYDKAVEMIKNSLKLLQEKTVEKQQLEQAKQSMIRYYISMKDSQTALMDFALNEWILKTNRTIEQFIKEIEQVTEQEVQKRAQQLCLNTIYLLQ